MNNIKRNLKQNTGFTLIELLIAIAVVAIMTVPLINSFVVSGRVSRNSRRAQNAQVVAQKITEIVKELSDTDEVEAALKNVYNTGSFTKVYTGTDVWNANMKATGADTEKFYVDVSLTPKAAFDYDALNFADVYNKANVIYNQLMAYDYSIVTLIKNTDIDYANTSVFYYNATTSSWVSYTPTDEDKAIRQTYGHLFADEYSTEDYAGAPCSDINSLLERANINKTVDILIEQDGDKYRVTYKNTFQYPYDETAPSMVYTVITKDVDPTNPSAMTYFSYMGVINISTEPVVEYYEMNLPMYFLYAKAKTSYTDDSGNIVKDPRKFKKTTINITYKDVAYNVAGTIKRLPLYLVEQVDSIDDSDFIINLKIDANPTMVPSAIDVYTNEQVDLYNPVHGSLTYLNTYASLIRVYSDQDPTTYENRVAYSVVDNLSALYKIAVTVYYDENGNGSYEANEVAYSIISED